jgi:hypothetical protein
MLLTEASDYLITGKGGFKLTTRVSIQLDNGEELKVDTDITGADIGSQSPQQAVDFYLRGSHRMLCRVLTPKELVTFGSARFVMETNKSEWANQSQWYEVDSDTGKTVNMRYEKNEYKVVKITKWRIEIFRYKSEVEKTNKQRKKGFTEI